MAVYTYGSRANPYIHNPDDYDYIVFAKNNTAYERLLSHKHALDSEDVHICLFSAETFEPTPKKVGDYIHYYISPVIGYFAKAKYNILYCIEDYYKVLRELAPTFPFEDKIDPSKTNKR